MSHLPPLLPSHSASATPADGDSSDIASLHVFADAATTCFPSLHQTTNSGDAWQRFKLITQLISAAATEDSTRAELVDSGVLEQLASCLVSHAIASKQFIYRGPKTFAPAPPALAVPNILSAITAIISGSNFRVESFTHSQSIRELFANSLPHNDGAVHSARSGSQTAADSLLPPLHVPLTKSVTFTHGSTSFPALRSRNTCLKFLDSIDVY